MVDNSNELVITSENPIPVGIRNGDVTSRNDLLNAYEEAGVIIINQLVDSNISMICDDTDVFILLIYFYMT